MNDRLHLTEQTQRYWMHQEAKEKQKLMDKNGNQLVIWGAAVAILAAAELYFEFFGGQLGLFLTKPFTMIMIMLHPAVIGNGLVNEYQKAILLGLMASVLGDVFLMVPGDYFLYGLVCFLTAHIIYSVGFFKDSEQSPDWISAIPFTLGGLAIFAAIVYFGNVSDVMLAPVGVYAITITGMAWLAWSRVKTLSNGRRELANYAFYGALLFVISDTVLAVNKFVVAFEGAQLVVMSTYFTAQYLIARSAVVMPRKRF